VEIAGVFVNVIERKDIPTGWASGPEYQLLDDANPDYAKTTVPLRVSFRFCASKKPGENQTGGLPGTIRK